jgi:hypothetical protein
MSDLPHAHPWSTPMFLLGLGAALVLFGLGFAALTALPLFIGVPGDPNTFRSTMPFFVAGMLAFWLLGAVALVGGRRMLATTPKLERNPVRAWRQTVAGNLLGVILVSGGSGIASGRWATVFAMAAGYGLVTWVFFISSWPGTKRS